MSKTVIILGATGLTGNLLLQKLLEDNRYSSIKLFSRSPISIRHPKIEEHLIDMFQLQNHVDDFTADEVFCCIGTTKAKTPDQTRYRTIDYGIPVQAAELCKTNNISTFIVVSALGANPKSRIFYNRIKGEMEAAVLKFNIPKTHILQPSLIAGHRNEKRSGEYFFKQLMKFMNPMLFGPWRKYRSIHSETIVSRMIWLANNNYNKHRIVSDHIQEISTKN